MGLHHVIIHTVTIHHSPVPEMIMVLCLAATGIKCFLSAFLGFLGGGRYRLLSDLFLFACSDRDSYGGGREPRGYMERTSGGSYREPYDGYGKIPSFSVLERA